MTVKEAINSIHAPKGVTSVLAGVSAGDFSVLNDQKGIEATFEKAEKMISKYQTQLNECKSDWSYWSILSDLGYWKSIKNILEAGRLNNGELAEVEPPDLKNCVVMDAIGRVEDFGRKVLSETRSLVKK